MQVKLDDTVVYEITDTDMLLLEDEIPSEILIDDIKRRLNWVITHKLEVRWEDFKKEWVCKMMNDPKNKSIPSNKETFINSVVTRSDYKNRTQRDVASNTTIIS